MAWHTPWGKVLPWPPREWSFTRPGRLAKTIQMNRLERLAWNRCLEGSHFTDGESEACGNDLSIATQLIPKAQPLGPDILALSASQFPRDGHVNTAHTRAKGTLQVQVCSACEPHSQGQ